MITPLIVLTVSAFSIPLLENSTYSQTETKCTLTVKEERLLDNTVLTMSTDRKNNYDVKIYHLSDLQAPSRGQLTQHSIDNVDQHQEISYAVDHNLFKRIDDKTAIYTATIANDNLSPQLFTKAFKAHSYRTKLHIKGLAPFAFIASQRQADAFFRCAEQQQIATLAKR
ncbi:hypothetical protein C0W96_01035 [Photobacterium kishitanii]|uniref:hypothetical protein n=1 Tax=Photobacterium kishitanii TaxID=318456 RepID=UPI0005D4669A|nr:hypothetical protein [Photobacterium kishitanii]KJG09516.1 hypothetical protein UB40_12430 [Photobacterium kishitanii]PSV07868.1 hypothetical protein C0W96_01035 [Photobacterium kishitanii]PSV76356.1 hypothetical protein C0W29_08275 [Photobacterium kishitanii]